MNCPNCNLALVISERHGVEIDYCPKCRGVWLDRGELDKILDRTSEPEREAPRPYRSDDDDRRYGGEPPRKKRGGLLGDIFDF